MSTETIPADVELRWARDAKGQRVLSDGKHTYFKCSWTRRVRWALIYYPDDGLGIRTHGAAPSLLLAIEDAHGTYTLRERYNTERKRESR